jgi:hypothetical protein
MRDDPRFISHGESDDHDQPWDSEWFQDAPSFEKNPCGIFGEMFESDWFKRTFTAKPYIFWVKTWKNKKPMVSGQDFPFNRSKECSTGTMTSWMS